MIAVVRSMTGPLVAVLLAFAIAGPSARAAEFENVALVQDLYEAFGKGDIDKIIETVSPDIVWEVVGNRKDCACFGRFTGKAGVGEFFKTTGEIWEFKAFEARQFLPSGDTVVVLGHYGMVNRKTGKPVESDWAHIFTLRDGKVVAFREFTNTAAAADTWK